MADQRDSGKSSGRKHRDDNPEVLGALGRFRTAPDRTEVELDSTVGEPDDGVRRSGNPGSPSQRTGDYDDDPSTDTSSK